MAVDALCTCTVTHSLRALSPLLIPPSNSAARDASTAAAAGASTAEPSRTYGGLADEDRIFTNLYRQGDPFIKVCACVCVRENEVACP